MRSRALVIVASLAAIFSAGDVNGFAPSWKPIAGQHQGACTQMQIDAYYAGCLGVRATPQACSAATSGGSASCASCLMASRSSARHGPILTGNGVLVLNVAGCISILNPSSVPCARSLQAHTQCTQAACDQTCPVTDEATLQRYATCSKKADASVCRAYASAAACTAAEVEGPAAACFFETFEDGYNVIAPLFCGP